MPTQLQKIDALTEDWETDLQKRFLASVEDIVSQAELQWIIDALERGDVEAALDAIHIEPEAYAPVSEAFLPMLIAGAALFVESVRRLRKPNGRLVVFRFDPRRAGALDWVERHGAELITRLTADQRLAARQLIIEGLVTGRRPRAIALDMVGRVSRATGKREGGVIGLTSQQERYLASMRERLASGDRTEMMKVLQMGLRDRRFDRTIQKYAIDGKPIPKDLIARMTTRYADRLRRYRGELIARQEVGAALNFGQVEALRQMVSAGLVEQEQAVKQWISRRDDRVRYTHTHQSLDGQIVGVDEVFLSASGATLRWPHDPQAPLNETANCRCRLITRVDLSRQP